MRDAKTAHYPKHNAAAADWGHVINNSRIFHNIKYHEKDGYSIDPDLHILVYIVSISLAERRQAIDHQ